MSSQAKRAQAKPPARERIAAERAARKRAEMRRRLLAPIAAVTAVLAIVGALGPARRRRIAGVPCRGQAGHDRSGRRADRGEPGPGAIPLQPVKAAGPPLAIGGKPAIVFVSEESCPFCAAERWPVAVALSHFGTWSHLGFTRSSATDVYPNTATLTAGTVTAAGAFMNTKALDQPLAEHRNGATVKITYTPSRDATRVAGVPWVPMSTGAGTTVSR